MHNIEECKHLSKYVKDYPPIHMKPEQDNIGKNVWCGNKSVQEYWNKQAEEHRKEE